MSRSNTDITNTYFEVENLGPIRRAHLNLNRKLIVEFGENGTGKSYAVTALKAVYDMLRFYFTG